MGALQKAQGLRVETGLMAACEEASMRSKSLALSEMREPWRESFGETSRSTRWMPSLVLAPAM